MSKAYVTLTPGLLLALCCTSFFLSVSSPIEAAQAKKQVLVISLTKGFGHGSIPVGEETIKMLGEKTGLWEVDFVRTDEEMAQKMTAPALKKYHLVFFNNTTGDLPLPDRQALLDWVKAGGGVVGSHAATDTFRVTNESPGWPDYIDLIGAQFIGHGAQVEVECIVEDAKHPATKDLPSKFKITDEIYLFKDFSRSKVRGLITLDKEPNSREPGDYPIAWVRTYGKGRVFYTSLGHRDDVWTNDLFQKHLVGGMKWALGLAKGDAKPVSPPSPVTKAEKQEGFRALFNTADLTGWHPRDEGRTPWTVQNGMLVMGKGGADIITHEKFRDFIVRYEYMVPKGGNSGLYLRGRYEIQVMDDFDRKAPDVHGNGSIYGKIAPSQFASRPAGEWQTVEAKLVGNRITVTLNGVRIVDDQPIDGVTGGALDDKVGDPGPIMLQGDHGPIAYRNIRVKILE
jgi:type 1 glutamine amidotransferase